MGDSQRTRRLSRTRTSRSRVGRSSRAGGPHRPHGTGPRDGDVRPDNTDTMTIRRISDADSVPAETAAAPEPSDRQGPAPAEATAGSAPADTVTADTVTADTATAGDTKDAGGDVTGSDPTDPDPESTAPEPTRQDPAAPPAPADASGTERPHAGDVARAAPRSAEAPVTAGTPDVPVRTRSRRVGRRRAVGPVIGDQLAAELLGDHRQDVLLSDRCTCGDTFPCRSRAFVTCFVRDEAYPPPDLEMPYRIVPPGVPAETGPRHAVREMAPTRVQDVTRGESNGRDVPHGGSNVAFHLPVDLDATVQFAKIPTGPPPVAVAV